MRLRFPALAILAVAAFSTSGGAVAQPGATGGSLGKSGKSVSGTAGKKSPAGGNSQGLTAKQAADPCRRAIGATWSWTNFGSTTTVAFDASGAAVAANGVHGTWKCTSGIYTVTWHTGVSETFTISSNGRDLSGTNFLGGKLLGKRQ